MPGKVLHDGSDGLEIRFDYDQRLVALVRALPERRWNREDRFWWVPAEHVVDVVDLVRPEGFELDEEVERLYVANNPGDFTVGRLNREVQRVLRKELRAAVWLVGAISGYDKSAARATGGRPIFFQLVEASPDGGTLAKVSCRLFGSEREHLEQKIAAAGAPFELCDELVVRVKVRVDLYVPHGSYQLIIEDLDVGYTLGEAARKREEILRRLGAEGLLTRNRSLPMPLAPLRVGLVTSLDSDAYNDVLQTLRESRFGFVVTACAARVQGRQTERSVLAALGWLEARAADLDVVLVCRGGGSRADLAWWDTELLGRALAAFPLPVVVGIGHEQDSSVPDAVARSCKTPTAAAGLLVERVTETLLRVEQCGETITALAARRLGDARSQAHQRGRRLVAIARSLVAVAGRDLDADGRRLSRGAEQLLSRHRERMARLGPALARSADRSLHIEQARLDELPRRLSRRVAAQAERERERSEGRARRLHLVDPARVLERGYAVLRHTATRRVVRSTRDAGPGDAVHAQVADGTLRLTVTPEMEGEA